MRERRGNPQFRRKVRNPPEGAYAGDDVICSGGWREKYQNFSGVATMPQFRTFRSFI
jgi:hypothetical protein